MGDQRAGQGDELVREVHAREAFVDAWRQGRPGVDKSSDAVAGLRDLLSKCPHTEQAVASRVQLAQRFPEGRSAKVLAHVYQGLPSLAGPETDLASFRVEGLVAKDVDGALGVIEHHRARDIGHRGKANRQVDLRAVRVLGEEAAQREVERHQVVKGLHQVADAPHHLAHASYRRLKALFLDADRHVQVGEPVRVAALQGAADR